VKIRAIRGNPFFLKNHSIRKMKNIAFLALLFPLFLACNPGKTVDKTAELTQKLADLDRAMGGANVTDKTKANEFIKTSEELAALVEKTNQDQYVDLLLKAGGLAITVDNYQKAIDLYKKVAEGLPTHPKAPTAQFLIAFVYDNNLNDMAKAKEAYETFLQKYPNDPDFADDAQLMLGKLGKSPDEIIKEFNQQQPQ
jgi:tetratricopeptide (TPR) repeat protein